MRIVINILIVLGIIVIGLLAVSQILPSTYQVEESIVIAAPPAAIYPWLNNLKKSHEWSPWQDMDPATVNTYSGPAEGVGAENSWTSKKLGNGSMKITESNPETGVKFDLAFDGCNSEAKGAYAMSPEGNGTKVTWSMEGQVTRNPLNRYFSLFMGSMIKPVFAQGLEKLKTRVENP